MPEYKAPLRDMQFVLHEVFKAEQLWQNMPGTEEVNRELADAILEESAKINENLIAPLSQSGHEEGVKWDDGVVTTPKGYPEAFKQLAEGGWGGLAGEPNYGGQNMPKMLVLLFEEMLYSSNIAMGLYLTLTSGAALAIDNHASDELKEKYLPNMYSGQWAGAMCLTESHAGTDLGMIRTKAEPQADGTYKITGTKIFITGGDHDLTENVIHLVLAKLPDAPAGSKGISLFLVPKVKVNDDGSLGERNGVNCGSIEHKMGIKASATCVMNFDGAKGFLVGEENRGLQAMFHMMNSARLGTALQGLAGSEAAFQGALEYARERLQMRSLSGPKNPDGPADPLIVHPDVRRMLLTQKALAEGSRAFIYWVAQLVDTFYFGADEQGRKDAEELSELLTPIAKAFVTETGLEAANHGMQVYGGHGYIAEWGMEQIVRDLRISTLYEGTTGIQALDLLGRKVMGSGGKQLALFTKIIHKFCQSQSERPEMAEFVGKLAELNKEWGDVTAKLGEKAMQNPDEVGAASVDYLMYSGYISLAYMWARMAAVALDGDAEDEFLKAKLHTARFYFQRLLPRTESHKLSMLNGADSLMAMPAEAFAF